jgi:hypothetical protein
VTAAEVAELILHGDPDAAVAAILAGRATVHRTAEGRTVVRIPATAEVTP